MTRKKELNKYIDAVAHRMNWTAKIKNVGTISHFTAKNGRVFILQEYERDNGFEIMIQINQTNNTIKTLDDLQEYCTTTL